MSTAGYVPEPQDVQALLAGIVEDLPGDPLVRYHALTLEQALYDALVSAIKAERGRCLAALAVGHTKTAVAELVGLGTRQRVEQLIEAATRRAA